LRQLHDLFQLSSIDLQRQAKNRFFLSGANQSSFENLLKNCQNIVTLDLLLSGEKIYQHSFLTLPSLNHLNNLRNLSLKIFGHGSYFEEQWKTLADVARQHKKLCYLSLNFKYGGFTEENRKNIRLFFDALQDSLTTLLLSFGWIRVQEECLESFAKNISNLKKLKSLYLDNFSLVNLLKTSMPCDLEQLKLKLSDSKKTETKLFESIFEATTKLTKLSLKVQSFDKTFNFSALFANLAELKDLELITSEISRKNWNSLIRTLPELKNLETLKIASKDEQFSLEDVELDQIQQIMKDHQTLKFLALGNLSSNSGTAQDQTLRIVVKKGYLYNIESFLCRFKQGFHILYNQNCEIFYI